MTLGRLMYLYQAEQQGKQIMVREYHYGIYGLHERFEEVKLSECELGTLISDDVDGSDYHYSYFIKKMKKINMAIN